MRRTRLLGATALVMWLLAACTPLVAGPVLNQPSGEQWRMVFADDFERDSLGSLWRTCHWWQVDGGCTISSNDELEWYRPEGVSVSDGLLRLTAEAIPQVADGGRVLPYRSGMVTTGSRTGDDDDPPAFAFTYGFVEARVRLPRGAGLWPAVWTLSADNTSLPEIDLMEWYGSEPGEVTMHVHQRVDGLRRKARVDFATSDLSDSWHVFGMRWTPDAVAFYVDGDEVGRVTDPALIPHTPMYLILNLAVGGPAGPPDATAFPATFAVDYVRVWQPIGDPTP